MGKYIIKRISYILLAFVVLSFLLFMIYHMLPVDKAAEKAKEEVQANKTLNYEERYQNWKVEYGFDGAKFERYLRWLGVSIPGGLCSTSRSSTKSVALTSGLRYKRELSVGLAVRCEGIRRRQLTLSCVTNCVAVAEKLRNRIRKKH